MAGAAQYSRYPRVMQHVVTSINSRKEVDAGGTTRSRHRFTSQGTDTYLCRTGRGGSVMLRSSSLCSARSQGKGICDKMRSWRHLQPQQQAENNGGSVVQHNLSTAGSKALQCLFNLQKFSSDFSSSSGHQGPQRASQLSSVAGPALPPRPSPITEHHASPLHKPN